MDWPTFLFKLLIIVFQKTPGILSILGSLAICVAVLAASFLSAIQASTNKLSVKEFEEGPDRLQNSIRWSIWIEDVTNQITQMAGKTDPQKAQLLINSIGEDLKTKYYSTERATTEDTEYKNVVKTLEGIICVSDPQREARDRYEMVMSNQSFYPRVINTSCQRV